MRKLTLEEFIQELAQSYTSSSGRAECEPGLLLQVFMYYTIATSPYTENECQVSLPEFCFKVAKIEWGRMLLISR